MFVVGIAGQAQNGKDTLADELCLKLNQSGGTWTRAAFALNVKKVFCETFGVDLAFVEKWKTNPEIPPGFSMNMRQALQFIGDGFRKIQPSIWLDLAFRDKITPKIISDVRYVNEFVRVKKEGGLNILVVRPDKVNDDQNGSEAQIRPFVDFCLKHLPPEEKFVDLQQWRKNMDHSTYLNLCSVFDLSQNFLCFDAFVRNDGNKDEYLKVINDKVVPFAKKFVFSFNEGKEEKCQLV